MDFLVKVCYNRKIGCEKQLVLDLYGGEKDVRG